MQPRPGRGLEQDLVEGSLSGEKGRSWEDVGTGVHGLGACRVAPSTTLGSVVASVSCRRYRYVGSTWRYCG